MLGANMYRRYSTGGALGWPRYRIRAESSRAVSGGTVVGRRDISRTVDDLRLDFRPRRD
jgi:hypothetical protein